MEGKFMECTVCGANNAKKNRFCFSCGAELSSDNSSSNQTQIKSLICKGCGGHLDFNNNDTVLFCPFCGSKELVIESDNVKIHKMTNNRVMAKNSMDHEYKMAESKRRAEQRKRDDHMTAVFMIGVGILCVIGIIAGAMTSINMENKKAEIAQHIKDGTLIQASYNSSELEDRTYAEVIAILEKDGFKNILTVKEKTGLF